MRVIAGSAGGTPLVVPPRGTRPVSDRAREGLFSSLGDAVVDADCLDLFAGLGRARDRGALARRRHLHVRGHGPVRGGRDRSEPRADPARPSGDGRRPRRGVLRASSLRRGPFDLVFLDPPYDVAGPALDRVCAALEASWLPERGWTVVVTRGHKSSLPAVPLHWTARRQLRYGDSLVILYGP